MKKYLVWFIFLISSMTFGMEAAEITVVTDIPNNNVVPKILAKEIRFKKSLQKSDKLKEVALKHARRYFDQNGQQNLNYNSPEYYLVLYALIAIENTFPIFSRFHKNIPYPWGYHGNKKLALLKASSINISTVDLLANFFDRYQIVYEGINTVKKMIDDEMAELNLTKIKYSISEDEKNKY